MSVGLEFLGGRSNPVMPFFIKSNHRVWYVCDETSDPTKDFSHHVFRDTLILAVRDRSSTRGA